MPRLALFSLALAAALAAPAASAENFTATLGFQNTDPKSGNGTLAGAEASVNDDWSLTGSFAYGSSDNWSVELWSGLAAFEHEVSLEGLGTVATVEHRPSKAGNYLGLTLTVYVTSREQLDEVYRTLTTHPMVKVVL